MKEERRHEERNHLSAFWKHLIWLQLVCDCHQSSLTLYIFTSVENGAENDWQSGSELRRKPKEKKGAQGHQGGEVSEAEGGCQGGLYVRRGGCQEGERGEGGCS